jgi:predicted kinase
MRNIYIVYGPPLSGKTTFTNLITKYDPDIKIVSRDIIRDNLKDHSNLPEIEKIITKIEESYIINLVKHHDIILDNTFSKISYLKDLIKIIVKSKTKDVKLKFVDFSDVPIETLLQRLQNRERKVPEDVIKKMHNRCKQNWKEFNKIIFDFNNNLGVTSNTEEIIYQIPSGKNYNGIIVDIDGTLSHSGGLRTPFEYHKVIDDKIDEIIRHIIVVYRSLGYQIIVVSGREDSCYEMTRDWLNKHGVPYDYMYMRKSGDFRKDSIVKKEIYEKYIKDNFNIIFCLDDRNQVVDMWRSIGIKCLQVQEGDF